MLKELSTIATDMLGLHGYPLTPTGWSGASAPRRGEVPAEPVAQPLEQEPPVLITITR